MPAGAIPNSMFSVSNFTDDLTKDAIDEETSGEGDWLGKTRMIMTINLKAALKASNDALANEKQKRVNVRRMYNTIITKITNHYKNKLQESCVSPWSQQSQLAQLTQQLPISIELIGQCKLCKIMFLTRPCIPSPSMRLLLLTGFMMKQLPIWTH